MCSYAAEKRRRENEIYSEAVGFSWVATITMHSAHACQCRYMDRSASERVPGLCLVGSWALGPRVLVPTTHCGVIGNPTRFFSFQVVELFPSSKKCDTVGHFATARTKTRTCMPVDARDEERMYAYRKVELDVWVLGCLARMLGHGLSLDVRC